MATANSQKLATIVEIVMIDGAPGGQGWRRVIDAPGKVQL